MSHPSLEAGEMSTGGLVSFPSVSPDSSPGTELPNGQSDLESSYSGDSWMCSETCLLVGLEPVRLTLSVSHGYTQSRRAEGSWRKAFQ